MPEKLSASLTIAARNSRAATIPARRFVCLDAEANANDLDAPPVALPADQTVNYGSGAITAVPELFGVTHAAIEPGRRGDVIMGPAIVAVETCAAVTPGKHTMVEKSTGRVRTLDTTLMSTTYRDGPDALTGATGAGQFVLVRLGPKIL